MVKLGTQAVDDVRRRVQQEIHGHCGRKGDPLYGIRTILRSGEENLTDRQRARLQRAIAADERHDEVDIAWQCAQQLRSAYKADNPPRDDGSPNTFWPHCPPARSRRSSAWARP